MISAAVALQGYISWFMWSVKQIEKPLVKHKVDLTTGYSLKVPFLASYSRRYSLNFRFYTDLRFEQVRGYLKEETFRISYRIVQEREEVAKGTINSENIGQISDWAGLYRSINKNPLIDLKSRHRYDLIVTVERGSGVLNKLRPVIILQTYYTLKGYRIPDLVRTHATLRFLVAGVLCLLAAGWIHRITDKKTTKAK